MKPDLDKKMQQIISPTNRHLSSDNSIVSKTNRQFYIRRKKQHADQTSNQFYISKMTQRTNPTQINQPPNSPTTASSQYPRPAPAPNQSSQQQRHIKYHTEKIKNKTEEDVGGSRGRVGFVDSLRISDRCFEVLDSRKYLEGRLRKWDGGKFLGLFRCFQKCMTAKSVQAIQNYQVSFFEEFSRLAEEGLEKQRMHHDNIITEYRHENKKNNALLVQNIKLQKQNNILRSKLSQPYRYHMKSTSTLQNQCTPSPLACAPSGNSSSSQAVVPQISVRPGNKTCKIIEQIKASSQQLQSTNEARSQFLSCMMMLQRKLEVKMQQQEILKREISDLKQQIQIYNENKRQLNQRIHQMKIKNQALCAENVSLQLRTHKTGISEDRNNCILAMQAEEILSLRYERMEAVKNCQLINKKYMALILKMKKMAVGNSQKAGIMHKRQIQAFPLQYQAFQQVQTKLQPHLHLLHHHHQKPSQPHSHQSPTTYQQPSSLQSQPQYLSNKQAVKKLPAQTQYLLPNFYTLISQDLSFYNIDTSNYELRNISIPLNFLGTMRAILDSKYNEFIMGRDKGHVTSFPAFVLGWLRNYQLGIAKNVEKVDGGCGSTRETVCIFYANLFSEKFNQSWEVVAFREFLLQNFGRDQLFFYLSLRFMLIGGDMGKDIAFCFEEVYYIDYQKCLAIILKLFKQNETQLKKLYEQFIRKSITYIHKKSFIDLHYIIRLMLQFYQSKKQKQIQSITKQIDTFSNTLHSYSNFHSSIKSSSFPPSSTSSSSKVPYAKPHTLLSDFQRIIGQFFPFLSMTEIVELYRVCYCVGNGTVSSDIVIVVLNEENVFLRAVSFSMLQAEIKVEDQKDINLNKQNSQENQVESVETLANIRGVGYKITPDLDWLYQFDRSYKLIYNTQLRRQLQSLGMEHLLYNSEQMDRISQKNLHARIEMLMNICMLTSKKMLLLQPLSSDKLSQVFLFSAQYLKKLSTLTLQTNQISSIMRTLKLKNACHRIVNFYRNKKVEMGRGYRSHAARVQEEKKRKKAEGIVIQFRNVVELAKLNKNKNMQDKVIEDFQMPGSGFF